MGEGGRALFFFSKEVRMSALAYQVPTLLTRLATMVGAAPLLAPVIHLFQNNIIPGPNTVLADLVECTFSGYVVVTGPFLAPGLDQSGVPAAPLRFLFTTDGVTPGVAYGLYIEDSAGHLVAAGQFDGAPYNMALAGQILEGSVMFSFQEGTITVSVGP
jgi:hypothetical protein